MLKFIVHSLCCITGAAVVQSDIAAARKALDDASGAMKFPTMAAAAIQVTC